MLKSMGFGDKTVEFSTAFAWTFIYRAQFGEDPVKTLVPTVKTVVGDPDINAIKDENEKEQAQVFALLEAIGFTGVAQIAWAMAKLADSSVPDPLTWIASFGDDFPVMDMVAELVIEAITSCFSTKKALAPDPAEPAKMKRK